MFQIIAIPRIIKIFNESYCDQAQLILWIYICPQNLLYCRRLQEEFMKFYNFFLKENLLKLLLRLHTVFTEAAPSEVFLGKGVLKICSKFTGEHPCRSVISVKLLCNFMEITLWHGCSSLNLLYIFRIPFPKTHLEGCFCKAIYFTMTNHEV